MSYTPQGTVKIDLSSVAQCVDFWSLLQEELAIAGIATDQPLPDIIVSGLPAGATVTKALLLFSYRAIENTNAGINKLSGVQYIKIAKGAGAYSSGIGLVDDLLTLGASSRENGDCIIGSVDLSSVVTGNDTYHVKWALALADLANLQFNDVQVGLKIWYKV